MGRGTHDKNDQDELDVDDIGGEESGSEESGSEESGSEMDCDSDIDSQDADSDPDGEDLPPRTNLQDITNNTRWTPRCIPFCPPALAFKGWRGGPLLDARTA
jgi:hypothetical protein